MNFEEIYSEINKLNAKDPATHTERLGKLTEEVGELAKAINKINGRKILKSDDTPENIQLEILDEGADVIQNVISILDGCGWSVEHLLFAIEKKNDKWKNIVNNKNDKRV